MSIEAMTDQTKELQQRIAALEAENERLQLASNVYRVTLRSVLKDIRDDIARGGMAASWEGVAETIAIVLEQEGEATPAPEVRQADQRWSSFDDWLSWELDQGDGTMAAASDAETRLARRLWFCLQRAPLVEQEVRQEAVAWMLRLPDGRITLEKAYPKWAEGEGDGYAIQPLYATPQPAPDVEALVEALEKVNRRNDHPARYDAEINQIVRVALAAHRQAQQGE